MPKARAYSSAAMSDNPPEAIAKGNILFYKSNASDTQKEKRKKKKEKRKKKKEKRKNKKEKRKQKKEKKGRVGILIEKQKSLENPERTTYRCSDTSIAKNKKIKKGPRECRRHEHTHLIAQR